MKRTILNIVGARPNFIKMAPFLNAAHKYPDIRMVLVHTGQHYDYNMSRVFFKDLNLPAPDVHLGVGSGLHSDQTARIMMKLEQYALRLKPALIVVVGDVNSTLAGALVAAKLQIPLAHIEAGVRSFDKSMPEEVNRVLTDAVSDILFAPSESARKNLIKEGVSPARIYVVGNIMIDALKSNFRPTDILALVRGGSPPRNRLQPKNYVLATLHRQANVDDKKTLTGIIDALARISRDITVFFPVHPRTAKQLQRFGLKKRLSGRLSNTILSGPVGYLDSLNLIRHARLVLTDSGGVQEESVAFNVPCITLRDTTEWVETLKFGNQLSGTGKNRIIKSALEVLKGRSGAPPRTGICAHRAICARPVRGEPPRTGVRIPGWDGRAAERMMRVIYRKLSRP